MTPFELGIEHAAARLDADAALPTQVALHKEAARNVAITPGWPTFVCLLRQAGVTPEVDALEGQLKRPPAGIEIREFEYGFLLALAFGPVAVRDPITRAPIMRQCRMRETLPDLEAAYLKRADARATFFRVLHRAELARAHAAREPVGKFRDHALRYYDSVVQEAEQCEVAFADAHRAWAHFAGEP